MNTEDYRINAAIRSLLTRCWVDTTRLDHGSVNGVVYMNGHLRKELLHQEDAGEQTEEMTLLLNRIEHELRNIRGVRDVMWNLENLTKVSGRWAIRKAG